MNYKVALIPGDGIGNPIATLWSVQMMLEFLGQETAAQVLMQAIETVTGSGTLTPDLGGTAGTTEFTDQVIAQLSV